MEPTKHYLANMECYDSWRVFERMIEYFVLEEFLFKEKDTMYLDTLLVML